FADRGRPQGSAADESGHLGRILHQVPGVVGELHLHQHVAGEKLALADRLLAALHFHDFFHGYQDLAEFIFHAGALDAVQQRALHAFLEARISVDDVPPLRHVQPCPNTNFIATESTASTAARNAAISTTNANTTAVVWTVSFRFGQDTR